MRILAAHIYHESNTFCPEVTRLEEFECFGGQKLLDSLPGVDILQAAGAEVIPAVYAQRWSSGTVEKAAFQTFLDQLLSVTLKEQDTLDGIYLSLHGGMTVEGIGSGEYRILEALRQLLGDDLPITVSMDMHANLKSGIEKMANVITGYHTAPHTDAEETQRKAARALLRLIASAEKVHPQLIHLPMLLVGERALSRDEPFRTLYAACDDLEKDPRFLAATVFVGMAWSDTPNTTVSVCVTPSYAGTSDAAMEKARTLAQYLFEHRNECPYAHPSFEPEEAVRRALLSANTPLYLSDSGDNPTAGGVGDATVLLRLILEQKPRKRVLFAPILDAQAYKRLSGLRAGMQVTLQIGSQREPYCSPVFLDAQILAFRELSGPHGLSIVHLADAAILRTGTVDIILVNAQMAFTSMECFASAGVHPGDYDIVVLKMGYMYAEISAPCRENIMALTPGSTPLKITAEQYHHLPRPIWPLDEDAVFHG